MSRRPTAQRAYHQTQSQPSTAPVPILYPPSGPSSGRTSPFRPNSSAGGSQYSESPYGGGMSSNTPTGSGLALNGLGGPGSGYGGFAGSGANAGYTRTAHDVEEQNDERLEGLLGKVKILKDITKGIGSEVRDSNLQLSGMNDAFASTSTFLGGTFRRMNKMAKKQGGNWCWFMMFLLFVLWIFVVVWWLRR